MGKKTLSRREFLSGSLAGLATAATAGLLAGCAGADNGETSAAGTGKETSAASTEKETAPEGKSVYIPGTYTGTATGLGAVTVTMTFSETAITDVIVDTSNETLELAINSASDFQSALMEAQSSEIDTISAATFTSDAVRKAAAQCIDQALGLAVKEEASASGNESGSAGYPSCEDLSGVNAATNQGDIAFVPEPIADSDIKETVSVDVLVCGQGPAGMAAALACAEKGLKVIALEKGSSPTWRSPTMGAFHDRIHRKFGVQFDTKQWLDDAMVNCAYRGEQAVYQKWIDTCDEAVDWFLDKLALNDDDYYLTFNAGDFPDFNAPYDELSLSRSWNTSINIPLVVEEIAATLQKRIVEAGAQVLFNTPVVQLVTEGDKVTGAIAKTDDGYIKYLTAKGVVLATGGYEFNPDKLNACCRPRDLALIGWMNGTKTNTGDGHEMAKAIGAMEDEYPHPLMLDPAQLMPYLRVNKRGLRFTAEYEAYNHLANAIQAQPGAFDYYIVDANCAEIVDKLWPPPPAATAPKKCGSARP